MKKHIFFLILLLCALTACHKDEKDPPPTTRTLIVYLMGDNNLSSDLQGDAQEILNAHRQMPENTHLIIYIDDQQYGQLPRIYHAAKDDCNLVMQYPSEQNSTSPATLQMVIDYAVQNYPAQTYGLVLSSHGSGWSTINDTIKTEATATTLSAAPKRRAFGIDEVTGTKEGLHQLTLSELSQGLSRAPKFEFIFFDECLAQTIESAYALHDDTDYIIASPAETPAQGAPFSQMLSAFFATPFDPKPVAETYYNKYSKDVDGIFYGCVISVVDCNQLERLAAVSSTMIPTFIQNRQNLDTKNLQRYCGYYFTGSDLFPDSYDFKSLMAQNLDSLQYDNWQKVYEKAVPYHYHTDKWVTSLRTSAETWNEVYRYGYVYCHDKDLLGGLSCFIPNTKYESAYYTYHSYLNEMFRQTAWYRDAGWSQTGW